MEKTVHNQIAFILVIVLSAFLVSCGSSNGGSHSHHKPAVCVEYDDFNDNTLDPWTASGSSGYSVTVNGSEVHMTAPPSVNYTPAASASITKTISLSGDFVVALDTTEQAENNAEWRH